MSMLSSILWLGNVTVIASANDFANGVDHFLPSEACVVCHRTAHRPRGRATFNVEANGRISALIWQIISFEP
jgi:hypothetical protein